MKRTLALVVVALVAVGCTPTDPATTTIGLPTDIGDADPYCILVVDGALIDNQVSAASAKAQELLNASIGNEAGLDTEAVNALGREILDNATQRATIYRQLIGLVDDPAVASSYEALLTFNDIYGIGVGEALSEATSFDDYAERAREIQARPEIAGLVPSLADDTQAVADYTGAHCNLS